MMGTPSCIVLKVDSAADRSRTSEWPLLNVATSVRSLSSRMTLVSNRCPCSKMKAVKSVRGSYPSCWSSRVKPLSAP